MFRKLQKLSLNTLLSAFLVLFLFSGDTNAQNYNGADITYFAIDSFKFEVTYRYYRDCSGPSFSDSAISFTVRSNSDSINMSPTFIEAHNITPICSTAKNPCTPSNTKSTGDGIEVLTFKDTINLTDTLYAKMIKNDCVFYFEVSSCCRNFGGVWSIPFYNFALVNICNARTNSSPKLSSDAYFKWRCYQSIYYNVGAIDTVDFDSLSYSFAPCLTSSISNYTYPSNLSYKRPFKAYDPTGKGINNPSANPPIGVYLDQKTGDFIATVDDYSCSESGPIIFEIKEWRKDKNGKYQLIGITRQDVRYETHSFAPNNQPHIDGPFGYSVCARDELCFNIT